MRAGAITAMLPAKSDAHPGMDAALGKKGQRMKRYFRELLCAGALAIRLLVLAFRHSFITTTLRHSTPERREAGGRVRTWPDNQLPANDFPCGCVCRLRLRRIARGDAWTLAK